MDEPIHQIFLPAECGNGVAVGHRLAVNREIRLYTRNLGIATNSMAKPGFDLVKNQDKTVPISQATKPLQISHFRLDDPEILEDGLHDERCDRVLLADVLYGLDIIEVNGMNELLVLARNSCANRNIRVFPRRNSWPNHIQGRHQIAGHVVMPPVVSALHNDDVISLSDRPS